MTLRPGDEWGTPSLGPPDLVIEGSDSTLARAISEHPGAQIWFRPQGSDFAASVGLATDAAVLGGTEVPIDAFTANDDWGVNVVVFGTSPDRLRWGTRAARMQVTVDGRTTYDDLATTVVVANGQFHRGRDLVPRGHPGDGRLEVQVYAVPRRERRALQARLATGSHVPHPRICATSGRRIEVRVARPLVVAIDGIECARRAELAVNVVPNAARLRV